MSEFLKKVFRPVNFIGLLAVGAAVNSEVNRRRFNEQFQDERELRLWTESALAVTRKNLAEAQREAQVDELTGLLNKRAWKLKISEHIERGQPFGVIFMDMDGFKAVNDQFGHETGDDLLRRFGAHLGANFRRSGDETTHEILLTEGPSKPHKATAGRYGGDEFGLIVELSRQNEELIPFESMNHATRHLRSSVAEFVGQQDKIIQGLNFNVSIGSAIWKPGDSENVSELLSAADAAMYADKAGKAR